MGLTNEVRNFFIKRINTVLDEKIKKATEGIDAEKVKQGCLVKLSKFIGDEQLLPRFEKLEYLKEKINKEEQVLSEDLKDAFKKAGIPKHHSYSLSFSNFEFQASEQFLHETLDELYPKERAEIKKLEEIKKDVEGAVLLSTTEPKLVETLNKLLNTYGGEINELLNLIPKQ